MQNAKCKMQTEPARNNWGGVHGDVHLVAADVFRLHFEF
jgi:hypothetical protein